MPVCPVCDEQVVAADAEFAHHVNAHFDDANVDQAGERVVEQRVGARSDDSQGDSACMICGEDLHLLSDVRRNDHVNACLDRMNDNPDDMELSDGLSDDSQSFEAAPGGRKHALELDWNGAAFAGRSTKQGKKNIKDSWWNPVDGGLRPSDVPSNFSPGLISFLYDMLSRSVEAGTTRRAVLSRPCVHIKGAWGFDGTWGCGYRNAMMTMSALLLLPSSPYAGHFEDPGVRPIQAWIEDAWKAGFDLEGKEQLQNKLVNTSKWIGTTDLYAMFSKLGVPCTLYDFRKPENRDIASTTPTHKVLERWVREYFDEEEEGSSPEAADPPAVRLSGRLPLILQHQGHSRTIVGYELDQHLNVKLLLFDPGKTVPKNVREAGLQYVPAERRPVSIKVASITPDETDPTPVRVGAAAAKLSDDSDIEVRPDGWVRRKVNKAKQKIRTDPSGLSLSTFRTSAKQWGPTEYQILAFSGEPLLEPSARAARKQVTSITVDV